MVVQDGSASGRRILDFMDERVAKADDPRGMGKALSNQFSGLWRYRIGDYRIPVLLVDN